VLAGWVSDLLDGTALARAPSGRLAEGIVTHIARSPVDAAVAREQHAAYAAALAAAGWAIRRVPAAEDHPDSVFVEDTVMVREDLAVLARPGAAARRAEVGGTAQVIASLGFRTAQIEDPGTLERG
jgi:dimethylargininase